MSKPAFRRLNDDWNADPNAPDEEVTVENLTVRLTFFLNPWIYEAGEEERASLRFEDCAMWRCGSTNDEGWHLGQCRYSKIAPAWGEFYELIGDDDKQFLPTDWHRLAPPTPGQRHFLFYLRDTTFECLASTWSLERNVH